MNINKINELSKKLSKLLDQPKPGLTTWNTAINEVAEELVRQITTVGENYLFCHTPDDDDFNDEFPNAFLIVHKDYWKQNQHLDDQDIAGDLNLPNCFNEVAESIFECDEPNGKMMLLNLGFIENNDIQL